MRTTRLLFRGVAGAIALTTAWTGVALADAPPPAGARVDMFGDFAVWTAVDTAAATNQAQSAQFGVKPSGGFWNAYRPEADRQVLPGDAAAGPSGYIRVEDLGVGEPEGPPSPEIIETYRTLEGQARVRVHHAYWSTEKNLQCHAAPTFNFFGGTVVRYADADGVARNFTGTGSGIAAVLGVDPFEGEFVGYRVPPHLPAKQDVPESGIDQQQIATNAPIRNAIAANAERLRRAFDGASDLPARQALFAAWFADQALLGRVEPANAEVAARATSLGLYDSTKFAALLQTLRENWAKGQNPKQLEGYAAADYEEYSGRVRLGFVAASRGSITFTASRTARLTLRTQTWKPARKGKPGRWSAGRLQPVSVPVAGLVKVKAPRRLAKGRFRFVLSDAQGRGGELMFTRRLR